MVRASGLRGYSALMQQLGADPASLLQRYRIAPQLLEDDDALIPLRSAVLLLEASATATACPDFGLRLAYNQDISVLGPLAIAMQNAPTVASAVDYASRYLFVHSPGMRLTLHEHSSVSADAAELRFEIHLRNQPVQRQTIDLCIADIHRMLLLLGGNRYHLHAVGLPHTPLAPLTAYTRFFAAPALIEQPYATLHVARASLQANLQAVNDTLRQIAVNYLSLHFRDPNQTLSSRVREALRRTLGTTRCNKSDIAGLLGLHPRTLQRQLLLEHSCFDALRDEVRKETALRYLCETRIPLSQISGMLGLSEQSALARSCKRWFGITPLRLRKQAATTPDSLHL